MMFPTPTASDQAGFAVAGLRPAYEAAWPELGRELNTPEVAAARPAATVIRLAERSGRAETGGALLVASCHLLADGTLCGAQIAPAASRADAGPTQVGWLLRAACLEAQAWRGVRNLPVCVALPRQAVLGGTLRAQVRAALAGARLPAGLLEVALAAGDLADAGPEVMLLVSALHDLGVSVAMDGLVRLPEGLHTLRRLPLSTVRLAASLTGDVAHSPEARALVVQAVRQAHRMETKVAATEVHSAIQRDILADLGCDVAQGPVFGAALPPAAFRRALGGFGVERVEH